MRATLLNRGPTIAALLQNEIQTSFSGPGAALPQINAGRIRGLAVTTLTRARELPDIPTMNESGYKGFEVSGWYGMLAPAKTPPEIVATLNGLITSILHRSDVTSTLAMNGAEVIASTPEAFASHLDAEIARWSKVVKTAGIRAD